MGEDKSGLGFLLALAAAFGVGRASKEDRSSGERLKREGTRYLRKVLSEWRPVRCRTEFEFEMALENYLLGRFSDDALLVRRQHGAGPSYVDIVVEDQFAIELKVSFPSESEVKRLFGQVAEMKERFEGGLVVLCGPIEEGLLRRLEREIREFDSEEQLLFDVLPVATALIEVNGPKE